MLAFDKERAEGNVATIYGIERVPCDTHIRETLDPVSPKLFRPVFKSVFVQLQRGKALEPMAFLDGHYVLGLDGTGSFSSTTMHCASCLQQVHRNGSSTYFHQMLGAAIIHPDMRDVMPLIPEPMVQHDGTDKNDGERHAAKRWVAKLRQAHPHRVAAADGEVRAGALFSQASLQVPQHAMRPQRRQHRVMPARVGWVRTAPFYGEVLASVLGR